MYIYPKSQSHDSKRENMDRRMGDFLSQSSRCHKDAELVNDMIYRFTIETDSCADLGKTVLLSFYVNLRTVIFDYMIYGIRGTCAKKFQLYLKEKLFIPSIKEEPSNSGMDDIYFIMENAMDKLFDQVSIYESEDVLC